MTQKITKTRKKGKGRLRNSSTKIFIQWGGASPRYQMLFKDQFSKIP
jgi:hypothetical protein